MVAFGCARKLGAHPHMRTVACLRSTDGWHTQLATYAEKPQWSPGWKPRFAAPIRMLGIQFMASSPRACLEKRRPIGASYYAGRPRGPGSPSTIGYSDNAVYSGNAGAQTHYAVHLSDTDVTGQ